MISLRTFCHRSFAGFAVLMASPWVVAGEASHRRRLPLSGASFETFASELGSVFRVQTDDGFLNLRLIRAEKQSSPSRSNPKAVDAMFEKFSLVFAGNRAHQLTQETYTFEHPRLGRAEMFIVPVGTIDPSVHKYEAVFNRPRVV